jgi:hypothetical protein
VNHCNKFENFAAFCLLCFFFTCYTCLLAVFLQVYDLSKLEGDEYGLSGGSPPPMRDSL